MFFYTLNETKKICSSLTNRYNRCINSYNPIIRSEWKQKKISLECIIRLNRRVLASNYIRFRYFFVCFTLVFILTHSLFSFILPFILAFLLCVYFYGWKTNKVSVLRIQSKLTPPPNTDQQYKKTRELPLKKSVFPSNLLIFISF